MFRTKFDKNEKLTRFTARVVVQGFHELNTGADRAAPVALVEPVRVVIANLVRNGFEFTNAVHPDYVPSGTDGRESFTRIRYAPLSIPVF